MRISDKVTKLGRRAVAIAAGAFVNRLRREPAMTLNFPNPTRSYDEQRNAVRFIGYDGVFEIRFMVEAAALAGGAAQECESFEAKCLSAFDGLRASIHKVARAAYASRRLSSYTLSAADFR